MKDSTIAYTGTNLPYPLSGPHLSNRVVYANIDGHVSWRFHDYDRAYRAGRFEPVPPALATSSGELEPVPEHPGPHDDAIRPRYERLQGFPDLWRHNLDRSASTTSSSRVYRPTKSTIRFTITPGFPIEDQWAVAAPDTFTRVYENQDARLYAVNRRERNAMTARPGLSIVIPAYCEAANIVGTLENVTTALEGTGIDAEILVIDDGSTDDTGAEVRANAARFPAVQLLTNERNCGFGWTYRRGVVAASREFIVMVHGDNAWGAATLADLFRHCGEADIIVGYTRDMWQSRHWSRTVASKTFTLLVNLIAAAAPALLQRPADPSGGRPERRCASSRRASAFRPRCSSRRSRGRRR